MLTPKPTWKKLERSSFSRKYGQKGLKRTALNKARQAKRLRADNKWAKQVLKQDGYRCRRCGTQDNLHAHHIAPRSRRPDLRKDLSNGAAVCLECHTWIHAHPIESTALGLLSNDKYELRHENL